MFTIFEQFNKIQYFISDNKDGSSTNSYAENNLALHTDDIEENVTNNRIALCKKLGIDTDKLIIPNQTHSNKTQVVPLKKGTLDQTDGLITNTKDTCIAVLTADCVPLIVYHSKQHYAGVIHAGWKGIINEIIPNTIDLMLTRFGGKTKDFHVGIGPCIGKKDYEVGEDVATKFDGLFPKNIGVVDRTSFNKPHIDLVLAAKLQLISCGLLQDNIESSGICTYNSDDYYSARKSGLKSGRFASGILLK